MAEITSVMVRRIQLRLMTGKWNFDSSDVILQPSCMLSDD
jgi:hypothetical protein